MPLAFAGMAVPTPLVVPAASAQAASGSLAVTTQGRHGGLLTTVTVVNASSDEMRTVRSGKRISLLTGRYIVMTDIYESAMNGLGTDIIGAQVVSVSGAKSVTLDACKCHGSRRW